MTLMQTTGSVLVAAAMAQAVLLVLGSMRRTVMRERQQRRSLAILDTRLAEARTRLRKTEAAVAGWNGFRKFMVHRKVDEGGGICSFYLTPHDHKPLCGFQPGQYLTFQFKLPTETRPLIRCYSLSDSPKSDYFRISVKRVPPPRDRPELPPGRSSSHLHDQVQEGDILDVKAPSGHFFLDLDKECPVVLIGGGVGLTPVVSMLNTLIESGSKREIHFFYGVTNGREHVMREHLDTMAREHENVTLHVCYSRPDEADRLSVDFQHDARVSVELMKQLLPSNNYEFYICGPPPMMASLTADLATWGVPDERVFFEAFGPASVKKKKPQATTEAATEASPIEVVFQRSGKTLTWDPAAESLLEFAEQNGAQMDSGCRAGNCGTCLTAVVKGEVNYNSNPGQAPEAGSCLPCIAVPKGNITLDA